MGRGGAMGDEPIGADGGGSEGCSGGDGVGEEGSR